MTGITRAAAAKVMAGYFHTTASHVGGGYDTYVVRDEQNRSGSWSAIPLSTVKTAAAVRPAKSMR